MTIVKLI